MGKVYLIGAGPGAADLITLRGAEILRRADIVFYDALVHPDTVALAANAKKVAVGKRCSRVSTDQRFINRSLAKAAQKYEVVVRLKGGDPMLFGRAQEEIDALDAAGIACQVVPGVTSALAAAADLGVSLTRRGMSRSVTFATPRIGEEQAAADWAQGVPPGTPAVVVENASLPEMRSFHCSLADLPQAAAWKQSGPALIMLGEVYRSAVAEAAPHNLRKMG